MYGTPLGSSDADGFVARVPDVGLEGYDLMLPAVAVAQWLERLRSLGAVPGSPAAWTLVRIEAGRPEWGLDMDDSTLAQEANLETLNAISFTKGCYTGQETVARIHFRGHVNRCLRGSRSRATCCHRPARTCRTRTARTSAKYEAPRAPSARRRRVRHGAARSCHGGIAQTPSGARESLRLVQELPLPLWSGRVPLDRCDETRSVFTGTFPGTNG